MTESTYWSRSLRDHVSRRSLLRGAGLAGAGLAGAALLGCGGDDETPIAATPTPTSSSDGQASGVTATPSGSDVKTGGIYAHAATNDPPTLDPYRNASSNAKAVAAHIYSRLMRINAQPGVPAADTDLTEDLAESVETTDGTVFTAKLRQGVKFHNISPVDGRELTSEDVLFSWSRLISDESPHASQVSNVVDVQAPDDYTVQFTLDGPSPIFLEQLADGNLLWIQPVEVENGGVDPSITPVGTGPWMLDEYRTSQVIQYRKHPEYFVDGVPYLDGIDLLIIPEYANRLAQFRAHNILDLTVTSDDVPGVKEEIEGSQWEPIPGGSLNFIFFSGEDRDPDAPWRDERFRQACSMAVDREAQMELGFNLAAIRDAGLEYPVMYNNLPVPASFGPKWWVDPLSAEQGPSSAFFQHSQEEARKLLDAVGVDDTPINFHYAGNNHYGPGFDRLAQVVHNWLLEIGLPVENAPQDYNSVYITQTFKGEFNGIALGVSTPFPEVSGYVNRFFGDDINNHGRVRDERITELNELQRFELDQEARREHFAEMQRRNGEMMYYSPVQPSGGAVWVAYHPEVRGIRRTRGYGAPTESLAYYWLDV